MKFFNKILHDSDFQQALASLNTLEKTRIFCNHGIDHLFDVARIAWIISLENHRSFDKESIYLAALLHDIGRCQSTYSHEKESVRIAQYLLKKHEVPVDMQNRILDAIALHRDKSAATDLATCSFGELLAYADQHARLCFQCAASDECYWQEDKKNKLMTY